MTLPFLIKYQGDDDARPKFIRPVRSLKEFVEDMVSSGKDVRTIMAVARGSRWHKNVEEVRILSTKLRKFLKMK